MFEAACGTYYITHNGTNCTQLFAGFAMMAAAAANRSNSSNQDMDASPPDDDGRTESTFQMVVELYVISLLAVFGLVGNILSVIVLRHDRERRDALLLLQASHTSHAHTVV